MSDDYTSYSVHGSQLRYAKSMLDANGIPISAINRQGDTYIIVIPAMYAGFDHHSAPQPHRSKPWWMPTRKTWVTLAMVAVVAAGAWMVFSGGITIKGVDVPKVDLPKGTLPTVSNQVDGLVKGATMVAYIVGGMVLLLVLWLLRGPLAAAGRMIGKVVHRGR